MITIKDIIETERKIVKHTDGSSFILISITIGNTDMIDLSLKWNYENAPGDSDIQNLIENLHYDVVGWINRLINEEAGPAPHSYTDPTFSPCKTRKRIHLLH
jgi:hypothetical protein